MNEAVKFSHAGAKKEKGTPLQQRYLLECEKQYLRSSLT